MNRASRLQALRSAGLYGIVDFGYCEPSNAASVCEALCQGGVSIIQLRAKDFSEGDILSAAKELVPICQGNGVPFIVNDFADVAVTAGADGVHIGQDDGDLETAREIVGQGMIVGRSTHSLEQARKALADGFDYAGFGPLHPTPTKEGRPGIGLEHVATVEREISPEMPVFFIGGLTQATLPEVVSQGGSRAVVVSDILKADDIAERTKFFVTMLQRAEASATGRELKSEGQNYPDR